MCANAQAWRRGQLRCPMVKGSKCNPPHEAPIQTLRTLPHCPQAEEVLHTTFVEGGPELYDW